MEALALIDWQNGRGLPGPVGRIRCLHDLGRSYGRNNWLNVLYGFKIVK
jgi:hypothetical protein